MRIRVLLISIFVFSLLLNSSLQLLLSPPLYAYHPLITDDTGTQGKGRFQYEFNVEYGHDNEAGIKTEELSINNTLTYGITDSIDIAMGIPYLYWKEYNSEKLDEEGISDIEINVKYRFLESEALKIAIKPSITIPSGDEKRGLGTGDIAGKIFLIIDKELKDITLFFNGGYIRNNNKIDERKDLWHISLAGEYKLKEDFKIVANIGMERNPDRTSNKNPAFGIVGFVYSLSDAFDIDGGIKTGLNNVETDLSLLAGITLRF